MKTLTLLLALAAATGSLRAASADAIADSATLQLNRTGTLAVKSAGPHVSVGTYRVQVSAKLGRPDLVLADGTWLYHSRRVAESDATGTLVVRFASGRVSSLALANATAVATLRTAPHGNVPNELVATR